MKSKVKAFVEYRFDNHLMKKNILNSYIIIMLFNILLILLSKGLGEQIIFGTMLFFFIFISNRVLSNVKKTMMKTYLYKGIVSIYLNILFTITFYYVIKIGQQHDFKILSFLVLVVIYFNVVSYILAKYNIKKGRYIKEKANIKFRFSLKKGLIIFIFILAVRILTMQYITIDVTQYSLFILYFIVLLFTFYFMFIFNRVNLQLLKAYYINKFNLEKDEFNDIDLAKRLSRC